MLEQRDYFLPANHANVRESNAAYWLAKFTWFVGRS